MSLPDKVGIDVSNIESLWMEEISQLMCDGRIVVGPAQTVETSRSPEARQQNEVIKKLDSNEQ